MTFSVSKCLISTSELNLYLMKINVQYKSNEQHADLGGGGGGGGGEAGISLITPSIIV